MLGPNYFQLVQRPERLAVLSQWDKDSVSELVGPSGLPGMKSYNLGFSGPVYGRAKLPVSLLISGLEATYMQHSI